MKKLSTLLSSAAPLGMVAVAIAALGTFQVVSITSARTSEASVELPADASGGMLKSGTDGAKTDAMFKADLIKMGDLEKVGELGKAGLYKADLGVGRGGI